MNGKDDTEDKYIRSMNGSILVVEDDEGLLRLIQKNLVREGLTTLGAEDGTKAFELIEALSPVLLLLDYWLPDMKAEKVVKILLEKGLKVPFIIMTGYADTKEAVEMMKLGARDYLVKDSSFLEFLPAVVKRVLTELDTERKLEHTEAALLHSEERYRLLFQESRDAIFITTMDGKIAEVNQAGLELFDYTREEASDLSVLDVYVSPGRRNRFLQEIKEKGFVRNFEEKFKKKDGTPTDCLVTATAHRENDGPILWVQGIVRDIGDYKRLQEQLLHAQKMEAVGVLAGGVAHDFNNLLTTIQGYTDLVMMKVGESDPLYRNLKQIRRASVRAAQLTHQLLLFSRRQPMEFTSLNINNTIEDLLKMLNRLIGEDIDIITALESSPWTIRGDNGNIEQVIMNLVVNARDAMPNGGPITIRTRNVFLDETDSTMNVSSRHGKFICLSVSDKGCGIHKEIIQHIFDPFFTTKGPGKGSGLGLSVVYGIVKEHEGWIDVESDSDRGSTFHIYLPALPGKAETTKDKKLSLREFHGNKEKILLVEDEQAVRDFSIGALIEHGYEVIGATTAHEALDIFQRERAAFELVFSDVVLPDINGIELLDQILAEKPELAVLLSSGYTDDKSKWQLAMKRGFPFLRKPYSLYDLLKTVKEAMGKSKGNSLTDNYDNFSASDKEE